MWRRVARWSWVDKIGPSSVRFAPNSAKFSPNSHKFGPNLLVRSPSLTNDKPLSTKSGCDQFGKISAAWRDGGRKVAAAGTCVAAVPDTCIGSPFTPSLFSLFPRAKEPLTRSPLGGPSSLRCLTSRSRPQPWHVVGAPPPPPRHKHGAESGAVRPIATDIRQMSSEIERGFAISGGVRSKSVGLRLN